MNRFFTVFSLALLLLTGCSGSDKGQNAAGSASPASSASSESSVSPSSVVPKPAPTFGPNHQELELTAEEQAAYQAGEYVPATEKHPALNVPVPVMQEKAKERSYEGAVAFVQYWNETVNYAIQTGNPSLSKAITSQSWKSQNEYLEHFATLKAKGKWAVTKGNSAGTDGNGFFLEADKYVDLTLLYQESALDIYSLDSGLDEEIGAYNEQNNPFVATLEWDGSSWKFYEITGVEGVNYE